MIPPEIINVVCPWCHLTWMTPPIDIPLEAKNYFCVHCGHTLTEEQAKQEAWRSNSIYYGE